MTPDLALGLQSCERAPQGRARYTQALTQIALRWQPAVEHLWLLGEEGAQLSQRALTGAFGALHDGPTNIYLVDQDC